MKAWGVEILNFVLYKSQYIFIHWCVCVSVSWLMAFFSFQTIDKTWSNAYEAKYHILQSHRVYFFVLGLMGLLEQCTGGFSVPKLCHHSLWFSTLLQAQLSVAMPSLPKFLAECRRVQWVWSTTSDLTWGLMLNKPESKY